MLNQDLFFINVYYIQLQLGMNIQFKFRKILNTFCRIDKQAVVVVPTKKERVSWVNWLMINIVLCCDMMQILFWRLNKLPISLLLFSFIFCQAQCNIFHLPNGNQAIFSIHIRFLVLSQITLLVTHIGISYFVTILRIIQIRMNSSTTKTRMQLISFPHNDSISFYVKERQFICKFIRLEKSLQ